MTPTVAAKPQTRKPIGQSLPMDLQYRSIDNIIVIDLADNRFFYPKTLVVKSAFLNLLQEGYRFFVLNLSQVEMLDSFGLAVIVSLLKLCKAKKGELCIYGANESVLKLFEITQVERIVKHFTSEPLALEYLQRQRAAAAAEVVG